MNITKNYSQTNITLDNDMTDGTVIFPDLLSAFCTTPIYINKGGNYPGSIIRERGKAFYNTMELLHAIHDLETKHGDPYPIRLKITLTTGRVIYTEYEAWDPYVEYSRGKTWFTINDYPEDANGDISPICRQWPLSQVDHFILESPGFTPLLTE